MTLRSLGTRCSALPAHKLHWTRRIAGRPNILKAKGQRAKMWRPPPVCPHAACYTRTKTPNPGSMGKLSLNESGRHLGSAPIDFRLQYHLSGSSKCAMLTPLTLKTDRWVILCFMPGAAVHLRDDWCRLTGNLMNHISCLCDIVCPFRLEGFVCTDLGEDRWEGTGRGMREPHTS